jgi:hypothetical protein
LYGLSSLRPDSVLIPPECPKPNASTKRINWHRWFGIGLTERFDGTPWRVELEKELALKRQRLDLVIIEQTGDSAPTDPTRLDLPDGLDKLSAHNLLTYKSQQEALDAWALDELTSHYVNYRKLLGALCDDQDGADSQADHDQSASLLPEAAFQLFAVATREPLGLFRRLPSGALQPTDCAGVHDVQWGARRIRLIVLDAVADLPRNALWELFSSRIERVRQGIGHLHGRRQSAAAQELLYRLFINHRLGLSAMTYTVDDFIRETHQEIIANLTPEERRAILREMPPEERRAILQELPPEERLRDLGPEERLRGLDPDALRFLDPQAREMLRQVLDKLKQ